MCFFTPTTLLSFFRVDKKTIDIQKMNDLNYALHPNKRRGLYEMNLVSKRTTRRIFCHHLVLGLICATLIFILYLTVQSADRLFRLSLATGYVGLVLLGFTFCTGALNVLNRRRNPVSSDLRRDAGIWCGIISLTHVVIGLQVHMGNMLLYFFREVGSLREVRPRFDLFGFANYTGLVAALFIVLLLLLSNDFSVRRLGPKRWKFLQRWNYAVFALVLIHSIAYQITESRQFLHLLLFGLIASTVFFIQISGFLRVKREA